MHKMRRGSTGGGRDVQRAAVLWGLNMQLAFIIVTIVIRTHIILGLERVLEAVLSN